MQILFHGNRQNLCFIKTGSWITGFTATYFPYPKVFTADFRNMYHFTICCISMDLFHLCLIIFSPFSKPNYIYNKYFYAKSSNWSVFNFLDTLHQILKKLENYFFNEIIWQWKNHRKNGKLKRKKAETHAETYAWWANNIVFFYLIISRQILSAIIWLNFQGRLTQRDLKLETNIAYTKFRKAGNNSQRSKG